MPDKTFTLDEANTLLPVLESLLQRAMDSRVGLETIDKQLQALGHKIYLNGGVLVDVAWVNSRKQARERLLQQIKDAVEEIHSTGVQVKDIEIGLLDFPCQVEEEIVLLCWKLGEGPQVLHWHGLEEGYAGRRPISSLKAVAEAGTDSNPGSNPNDEPSQPN